jgi:N-acyl-D-amino-acid deacylase
MADLDLVLKGGIIFDGTGGTPFRGDIGLQGDRISEIAAGLRGAEELDCANLAVAPGFIDTHSHSDLVVLDDPTLPMKVRQGITLEVFGQDGISVAPVRLQDLDNRRRQLAGLLTDPQIEWSWGEVDDYLKAVAESRPAPDVAYLVPHGAVRESVMGMEDRPATEAELTRMKGLLARSLDEGAFGISTGLIYPPCCYADTNELVELCEVVAGRGLPIVVHMRSESDRIVEAMEEMFIVGRRSGVHVHISHFKIAGRNNWGKLPRMLAAVEKAKADGVQVTADQYPYVAGSTMLGAILPPWAHAGGPKETVARLRSKEQRDRMAAQIRDTKDSDWDNFWKWSGPEGILIADVPSGKRPQVVGKSVKDAAKAASADPLEFAFDLLASEAMGVAMVSFSQSEEVVGQILALPYVNACTDGLLGGRPHPRAYGTCPRILGRYVREKRTLSLEAAIRKLTGLAADTFGFADHGYLLAGKRANLVVFDPATVSDPATFEDPVQYPKGIPHVIVGGKAVVRDNQITGERPGRVLRRVARH